MFYRKELIENKKLSFIGLGCWLFGEQENPQPSKNPGRNYWNGQKRSDSLKIFDFALKSGITHFDTAQSYGLGLSEQFTGHRLRRNRRDVVIATKFIPSSNNSADILKKIKLSLKRLNTSYIDIMYLHWPDRQYEIEFAAEAFEKARKEGLIRYTGICNFSADQMEQYQRGGRIDFCQTGYNLLWRHREKDVVPYCISNDINIISYSFYAQGLLLKDNPAEDKRIISSGRKNLVFLKNDNIEKTLEVVRLLGALSDSTGFTKPQLLAGWALSKPWLSGILTGASSKKQIMETIDAVNAVPGPEIVEKLDDISLIGQKITDTDNIFSHNQASSQGFLENSFQMY
ncbi:MAG: aldo/keto reductase [Spirochaetia bacterium]|jgi:aryl-alcohol dehydrogenase-like predicted oxidoreductase|nr:aldo/keto reductase [Spirochaetia bacterium]